MSITPHGRPWDRDTHDRIKRKGGEHFRSPCQDYIDVERKIEAGELRYADRVEVYGTRSPDGFWIMDTVVVLNGGVYMSTGIKAPDEPITVRQGEHDEPTEQERYDSISVTGSGRQVEDDEDPTDINPERGLHQPKRDAGAARRLAIHYATKAAKHRREARLWAIVAATCLLLMVGVLVIPSEWIFMLFEAFE